MKYFLLGLLVLSGCNSKKEKPANILIGYYGSLTGKEAAFGIQTLGGIELAMVEINRAGGIDGRRIEIRHYDTKGSLKLSEEAVTKLIEQDKVVAIIGENISSRTLVGAKIAQEKKVPMITPTGTNPKITEIGDYIFRACFIDSFQGEVIAKFAYTNLNYKTVAIYRDGASPYSTDLAEYFIKTFTGLGGKVLADESYYAKDVIYLTSLMNLKKVKADFIFIPGYYHEVSQIAKQARDLKFKTPMMGGDGWEADSILSTSNGAVIDSYFSSHFSIQDPRPEVKTFISEYSKLFGDTPDSFSASGYDAANLIFNAIKTGNSTKPDDIRDSLASTQNYQGITGSISIDKNRNPIKPAVVLKITDEGFKFADLVRPNP